MRRPLAFLITILPDEIDPNLLQGRVRFVALDQEGLFTNASELVQLLREVVRQQAQDSTDEPPACGI
jgi:hypothetical protein